MRRARRRGQPPQRRRPPDLRRRRPGRARGDARRDPDLRAPRALGPDLRGRVRAPSATQVRAHRAGHELGSRHARQPRLVHEAHAHPDRGRVPLRRRGGRAAVAHAERVLPAELLDRRELHPSRRIRAPPRRRRRPHHVGQRLPALRRLVPLQPRGAARVVRGRAGSRGPHDVRGERGRRSTASTSTGSTRSRRASGPTVAEIAEPLAAFPADSTCNAFDPDAIVRTW